jgi:opacity protein-like surface antigen
MKKIALMVLVAAFAATPAMAASKKKAKKMHTAAATQTANPNDAGWRLTKDALPGLMPTAFKFFYYSQPEHKTK